MTDVLQFTLALARTAGELIVTERAGAALTLELKNGNELVTNADLAADNLICQRIAQHYDRRRGKQGAVIRRREGDIRRLCPGQQRQGHLFPQQLI